MKRAKIGALDVDLSVGFWTNGKNANNLRQNERELYAIIDLLQTKANYAKEEDLNAIFNEMDKAYIGLQMIKSFASDETLLYQSGLVINNSIVNGDFDNYFETLEARNNYISELSDRLISETNSNTLDNFISPDFAQWWKDAIVDSNYYIDITTGEKTKDVPQSSAVISGTTDEFCAKLKKGGLSLLYVYCDKTKLTSKQSVVKYFAQKDIKESLKVVNPAFSESVCNNLIVSGIMEDTKGMTPEEAVDNLKANGKAKIGALFAIVSLIVTAVVAICGMVQAIYQSRKAKSDAKTAQILADSNINDAAANEYDFPAADYDGDGVTTEAELNRYKAEQKNKILIYGAIALGALWFLTNN